MMIFSDGTSFLKVFRGIPDGFIHLEHLKITSNLF